MLVFQHRRILTSLAHPLIFLIDRVDHCFCSDQFDDVRNFIFMCQSFILVYNQNIDEFLLMFDTATTFLVLRAPHFLTLLQPPPFPESSL